MGIAIIIPDVSFSELNIGQVTPSGNKPLVSLSISGNDSVIGAEDAALFTVDYSPADTTQRGVVWSIVSGDSYATIDDGGNLSVLVGASENNVTIRATSSKNSSIYAEKTITVTYYQEQHFTPLENLTARLFFQTNAYFVTDIVLAEGDYIKAKFAQGRSSGSAGCIIGSRKVSNADTDSTILEVDTSGLGFQGVKSKIGGRYFHSETAAVTNTAYTIIMKEDSVETTPALSFVEGATYTYSASHPLAIGAILLENNNALNTFYGDLYGVEIYGGNGLLKHRFIPQSDLTILDEVTGTSYSKTGTGTIIYTAE